LDLNELTSLQLMRLGGASITLGRLLGAVLVVAAAMLAARVLAHGFRRLRGRARYGGAALYIFEKIVTYALVLAGVFAGLSTLGINLTSFAVFAGALGVGVGIGLQGVVREFVSGLVILFDRQANVGDFIELEDGQRGLVVEVGPRATRIRTNDNVDVIVPNSKLIENPVINWTLKGDTRRIHVPFAVAYGSDRECVRRVVLEAAHALPFTLPDTETRRSQVWLVGFGESALNFELVVWPTLDAVKRPATMQAAYTWAIADALDKAGVEIPYAQMEVRLRSLFGREGEAALRTLKLEAPEREPAAPIRPAQAPNDAAETLVADARQEAEGRPREGSPAAELKEQQAAE
jgi:small-conductance mechanosensitive channel